MKMNLIKSVVPLVLSTMAWAWTADSARYPIREIDRPLILPKKMWQEQLFQNTIIHIDNGKLNLDPDAVVGFLPLLPSWSITDNLEWTYLPAPLFKYLLTRNNINTENGRVAKGLSVTVGGGLSAVTSSSRDGTYVNYNFGLEAKRPILAWLWWEGTLQSYYKNVNLNTIAGGGGIGWQITDRMYAKANYDLTNLYEGGYRVYHGGSIVFGTNFTPNISLQFSAAAAAGSKALIFNPGGVLSFQW